MGHVVRGWRAVVILNVALIAALLSGAFAPAVVGAQESPVSGVLVTEGERRQIMQFNPDAALQQRIFNDGLVPNSAEFRLTLEGVTFAAQRAEHLGSGQVRVYFARVGDWGNVVFVQRGEPGAPFALAMLEAGEQHQVMQFNPDAALQKKVFADSFVPNSPEFQVQANGVAYIGQRAEHLRTGEVRVYYAPVGGWDATGFARRPVGPSPPAQYQPAPVFAKAMRTYDGGFMGNYLPNTVGQATGPARETRVAEQVFGPYRAGDCGYPGALFLWREDTRQVYFLPVGTGVGLHAEACRAFWQVFPDTWRAGDPNNEDLQAPAGKVIPQGGIGKVWRQHFYTRSQISVELPAASERATTAIVQPFENATLIYLADSPAVYLLFDRFRYQTRGGDLVAPVWFQAE